jgi:predicted phosphoribosyltransferase
MALDMQARPFVARFRDRRDAGRWLAEALQPLAGPDAVVLGLPRGGIPVAYEIARALDAPLDVFVVRKLGAPGEEELAVGAVASGGLLVLAREVVTALGLGRSAIERLVQRAQAELRRSERLYRALLPPIELAGRTAIVVDDGLATGASLRAAVRALRARRVGRLIAAVPVGPADVCADLAAEADRMICGFTPEDFTAVGIWYERFGQVSDAEVCDLLAAARREWHRPAPPP